MKQSQIEEMNSELDKYLAKLIRNSKKLQLKTE